MRGVLGATLGTLLLLLVLPPSIPAHSDPIPSAVVDTPRPLEPTLSYGFRFEPPAHQVYEIVPLDVAWNLTTDEQYLRVRSHGEDRINSSGFVVAKRDELYLDVQRFVPVRLLNAGPALSYTTFTADVANFDQAVFFRAEITPKPAPKDPAPSEIPPPHYLLLVDSQGVAALYALVPLAAPAHDTTTIVTTPTRSVGRRDGLVDTFAAEAPGTPTSGWLLVAAGLLLAAVGLLLLGAGWIVGAGFPLFSRFSRDDVLDHGRRQRIYECIRADPGLAFGRLCERLGLSCGVVQHHITLLERHGLVRRVRDGRTTHLYVAGVRHAPTAALAPTRARILALLAQEPGLSASDLARRLGQTVQSTWEHLRRLDAAGLLVADQVGRSRRWRSRAMPQPCGADVT